MSSLPKPSAVIFAKDVARVAKFYATVAGMSIAHADGDHIVLDSERFQVVIHAIPKHIADTFTISMPPEVRENTPIKLCLPVASIAGARTRAASAGGMVGPQEDEWQARGFRACDGHDPEGNVVQFREAAP